jgi:hypothetical protein
MRHVTPSFGVKSSSLSRSSSPRREEGKKSFLSAQSAGIDDAVGRNMLAAERVQRPRGALHCSHISQEDGANLEMWLSRQCQLKTKEKLDAHRRKRLDEIGFERVLPSATLDSMFALFKEIQKHVGHCIVLTSHKEERAILGTLV